MLEDMRKLLRAGADALSMDDPDDAARMLKSKTRDVTAQLSSLAAGILQWSAEARDSFRLEIRELVARQIKEMGVATQKELHVLRGRVEELERSARANSAGRGAQARAKAPSRAKAPARTAKGRAKSKGSNAQAKSTGAARAPRASRSSGSS